MKNRDHEEIVLRFNANVLKGDCPVGALNVENMCSDCKSGVILICDKRKYRYTARCQCGIRRTLCYEKPEEAVTAYFHL